MTPKPIDFSTVEALRKHMLLTIADMSQLFGVSRVTYHSWVRGKSMRKSNEEAVRTTLKELLAVMTEHGWPMPDVIGADQKLRYKKLLAVLGRQ
jgi:DNA-binding transcriptional regulator YiaG